MVVEYLDNMINQEDIIKLYDKLDWLKHINGGEKWLVKAMENSTFTIYVYVDGKIAGTGRVISDGMITALICGIGVLPEYRGNHIGKEIVNKLVEKCKSIGIDPQLTCKEGLVSYYEELGFDTFGYGMQNKKL